ncbi:MAG: ribonuclease R [Clostridia bacterium]|nr:ribonuclease R [Clostridia bacterium]
MAKRRRSVRNHSPKGWVTPKHSPASKVIIKRRKSHGQVLDCIFHGSGSAFGFARPTDPEYTGEDLFIPPALTEGAMNGDAVKVQKLVPGDFGYGRGNEGKVTEITERRCQTAIGVFRIVDDIPCVIPDDKKLGQAAEILYTAVDITEGDKVKLKITKYPDEYKELSFVRRRRHRRYGSDIEVSFAGDVEQNYGNAETKAANYEAILDSAGIPRHFSEEVLAEADSASKEVLTAEGRLDLRGEIIFTIDGAGAKDLDDAISISRRGYGYTLGVHIADVSHYVKRGGAVDTEAYSRGTSVYFVDKVVPMLPEVLSNGCCSLNAGEDKYALSAIIDLDRQGEIESYSFAKSIIRSAVRGVYSEVNDILDNRQSSAFAEKYANVMPSLEIMEELYRVLEKRSRSRGALDMDGEEAEIVLDSDGMPVELIPRERGVAERIIEQFMLRANVAAASFLKESGRSGVYRIHEEPASEKMQAFAIFAYNMGLDVNGICRISGDVYEAKKNVTPAMLSEILSEAKERGISEVVSGVMLRSLMKAKYSPAPALHFGLAEELYCHFTSPIRRYPDLFVHRSISAAIAGDSDVKGSGEAAAQSTDTEIRAVEAERAIEDLYMALYMSKHIGEEYDATVSSVTSFGIFARTDNLCEGLIPTAALGEVLSFNDRNLTMTIRRDGGVHTIRLGDRIRIRVVSANVATGKVEFLIIGYSSLEE